MIGNTRHNLILLAILLSMSQNSVYAQTAPSTSIAAVDTSATVTTTNTVLQTPPPAPAYTRYYEINTAPQYSHLTGVNIPNKASGSSFTLARFDELRFKFYRNSSQFSFPNDNAVVQSMGANLSVIVQTNDGYYHVCTNPSVTNNPSGFNDGLYTTRTLNSATWSPDITDTTFLKASIVYAGGDNTNNLNIGNFRIVRKGSANPDIPPDNFTFIAPGTEIDNTFTFQ